MKRIVILSDTHGLLRPEVLDYFSQADAIIHGGHFQDIPARIARGISSLMTS